MARYIVTFEIRKQRDDDLRNALEQIPKQDRSEFIRSAIRAFLYPGDTNTPHPIQKTNHAPTTRLEIDNVTLVKKEKSAEELSGALDDLLGEF